MNLRWWTIGVGLVVVAIHSQLIMTVYGGADDFDLLRSFVDGELVARLVSEGRCVLLAAYALLAWIVDGDIEKMHAARVINVLGLSTLGMALFRFLERRFGAASAFSGAVVSTTTLAAVELVNLQPAFPACFAAAAVVVMFDRSSQGDGTRGAIGAAVVLALSAAVYQPIVFFWVACIGVDLLRAPVSASVRAPPGTSPGSASDVVDLRRRVVLFALGCVVYLALFYALPLAIVDVARADGSGLGPVWLKLVWFVMFPLRDAFNPFHIEPATWSDGLYPRFRAHELDARAFTLLAGETTTWRALVVFALWTGGLLAFLRGSVARTGLVLLALPATYGIGLVIDFWWPTFRMSFALYTLVSCVMCVVLVGLVQRYVARKWVAVVVAATLCFGGASLAWSVERDWIVGPLRCEWEQLFRETSRTRDMTTLRAVRQLPRMTRAPSLRYDLGYPASARITGARSVVPMARRAIGAAPATVTLLDPTITAEGAIMVPAGEDVLILGCHAR